MSQSQLVSTSPTPSQLERQRQREARSVARARGSYPGLSLVGLGPGPALVPPGRLFVGEGIETPFRDCPTKGRCVCMLHCACRVFLFFVRVLCGSQNFRAEARVWVLERGTSFGRSGETEFSLNSQVSQ